MEVSSTSSTRHRRLRRCSATSPDQALTSAFTDGQLTPWRRTTARIVITCASATRRCARRRVSQSVELGVLLEPSAVAAAAHEPPPHPHQRRAPPRHLKVAHRALAGVVHPVALEPAQCGQRGRLTVDSTRTRNSLGVSTTTASTRIWRRCRRTRITSEAIGALLDR